MKKTMLLALIFGTILATYIAMHAGLFVLLVKLLGITSAKFKFGLVFGLSLLALSFFVATYLSHRQDTAFTRGFYFFAGSWVGILINLVIFLTLAFAASKWLTSGHGKQLALVAILLALLYSGYGVWNAFNPRVNRFELTLKNLPAGWKGKKIVQLSDVHLGHIYSADYLAKIAGRVNALKPDLILLTGDLFDGTDGNLDQFIQPLNKLAAAEGIYFVTGNHETYLGTQNTLNILAQTKIQHLKDQMVDINGLQLIGIDNPERNEQKDVSKILNSLAGYDKNKTSILLWHVPVQIDAIKKAGITLQLSGHTHKGQLFPFGLITYLTFKGYDAGLTTEGEYNLYTSTGLGGWGPPMRTQKDLK